MEGYSRLNDPVAYGEVDESDETLVERARDNLTVDGMDDEWLDFEAQVVGDDEVKAVYLYTLILDTESNPAEERITNEAQDSNYTPALEGGPGCTLDDYWSHIVDSWTVEGGYDA